MSKIIKLISVSDKSEAEMVINNLMTKYRLTAEDPENILDVSNDKLHVFYDSDSQTVTLETNDQGSLEEYLKELAAEFPTFF
jgi:hypothetical protein